MAATRITSMDWIPATCSCRLSYGLWRDGSDYNGSYIEVESIVESCDEHSEITDPEELETAILALDEPFAKACGAIADEVGELTSWEVSGSLIVMVVDGASAALQSYLNAIPELSVTYT